MALQTKEKIGLQAVNDPTRIAEPVQGTLPASLSAPEMVTQPTMQLNADLEAGGFTQSGQQNVDQMAQELFNFDQQLEGQYKTPFPQVEGYVDNPADAMGAYGQIAQGMAGNINMAQGAVDTTKASYDRAVSAILDRFMNFYEMQERQREAQEQREYQRKKDQLDFEMQIAQMTGGTVTNPFTGEKVQIPVSGQSKDPLDEMIPLEDAVKYGLPIGTTYRDIQGQQLGMGQTGMSENEAILQVLATGGDVARNILNTVPPSQKGELAQTILQQGGISQYRQSADLLSLLSDPERSAYDAQSELLQDIDVAKGSLQNYGNRMGGTGPIAGWIPDWMANFTPGGDQGRQVRAQASRFLSDRLIELSGSQITPFEAQRLQAFLPTKFKTEAQNIADLENLRKALVANQDIFEYSKRRGQTLAEAYRDYGPTAFANAGLNYPESNQNMYADRPEPSPSPYAGNSFINQINAQQPVERFTIELEE